MKKVWVLVSIIAVVGICGVIFFFGKKGSCVQERAVLYQRQQDIYYTLEKNTIQENWDDGWNTYIVSLEDQFDSPKSMSLEFTRDEEHLIILYREDFSVNGRWLLGAGKHSIEFSPRDAYIYIAVHDAEEEKLNLTAYSTETAGYGAYQGKYLSVLGDSISSYYGYLTDGCLAGYNESHNMKVSDMWWYEMARLTGMNISAVNASGGSGVTNLGDPQYMGNGERSRHLDSPGKTPDVICVLLGINDFFSNVDYEEFRTSYEEMVEIIKEEYPLAEIMLCTYFELPGPYKANVDDLNEIIRAIAEKKGFRLLDLHGSNLSYANVQRRFIDYNEETGSAVHPNAVGQKIIGSWAAELLR